MASSQYITVAEAAAHFGVSVKTIRKEIQDGHIAHVKIRGAIRIPRSALDIRPACTPPMTVGEIHRATLELLNCEVPPERRDEIFRSLSLTVSADGLVPTRVMLAASQLICAGYGQLEYDYAAWSLVFDSDESAAHD